MKKVAKWTFGISTVIYVLICTFFYFNQERIILNPTTLDPDYSFRFSYPFEEWYIQTEDGVILNAVLFKADESRGLVFYLHGNRGSLNNAGNEADPFLDSGYDVFMMDYRGFGKSDGSWESEEQLLSDVSLAYEKVLEQYDESQIIIAGYSLGTGPATYLAARHHPQLLILQAPYFSLVDIMEHDFSFLPTFILKYPLETGNYLPEVEAPVVIFHGDRDNTIYYGSSLKLQELFKPGDQLITLEGGGHGRMRRNTDYLRGLAQVLSH